MKQVVKKEATNRTKPFFQRFELYHKKRVIEQNAGHDAAPENNGYKDPSPKSITMWKSGKSNQYRQVVI